MSSRPKTLIIIPALNEQDSIVRVIAGLRQHAPWADIAVINDGSTDRTGALAEAQGVIALHMPYNVGIGAAVQTGMLYADRGGYQVAIQHDGDGQHPPEALGALVDALAAQNADVIIGSRFIEKVGFQSSRARRAGIALLSWLIRTITGWRITDPTSGCRASGRRAIRLFARDYPYDYPEPEAVVLAWKAGLHVREIPVQMRERQGGRSSIFGWRSAYYMLKVIMAILIGLLRKVDQPDADQP